MGKNAKNEARKLGFHHLPLTTLYGRPKKMKMMFSKYKPDTVKHIGNYLKSIDPSFIEASSGGGRNNTFYLLAEQARLYVELEDKMSGFNAHDTSNHVERIKIYSEKPGHVREIAKIINQIWDDGIFPHMEWEKLEKKYKVSREEIMAKWNELLSAGSVTSTASVQQQDYKICEKCGAKNIASSKFCTTCGEKF